MKKFVKYLLPLLVSSNMAMAGCCDDSQGVSLKLSGSADFSAVAINHAGPKDKREVSVHKDNLAFYNTAKFTVTAENKIDEDTKYGANVAIQTSARNARSTPTEFYFESTAGKVELGSGKSVVAKMKITGDSSAVAAKGMWDVFVNTDIRDNHITYFSSMANFLDAKTRNSGEVEYSRKISYYTPKMSGLQFGVSYIPDSSNAGGKTVKTPEYHVKKYMAPGYMFAIKDGIGWGATYENEVNDDFKYKLALVGERGKVIPLKNPDEAALAAPNAKFKNLSTYTLGGTIEYQNWSFSGAYADYMKSFTSAEVNPGVKRDLKLYSFGAGYHHGDLGLSVTHFASNTMKNKINALTFGVDYKLAPGLLPYAEITPFSAKGSYLENGVRQNDKFHGTFFVAGLKLEF
jgi:predicted porin